MNENGQMQTKDHRHYWLREDFDELIGVIPGADLPVGGGGSASCSLVYPKWTRGAVAELKLRGLECDAAMLVQMAEKGVVNPQRGASVVCDGQSEVEAVPPGDVMTWSWSKADIDAAAEYLYDEGHWGSWTHFCWVANLRYGQAVKAHRVACLKYDKGFSLNFDVPGFVTVIEPAADASVDYARVQFYPGGTRLEAR